MLIWYVVFILHVDLVVYVALDIWLCVDLAMCLCVDVYVVCLCGCVFQSHAPGGG